MYMCAFIYFWKHSLDTEYAKILYFKFKLFQLRFLKDIKNLHSLACVY